jgi:hypothetical protein
MATASVSVCINWSTLSIGHCQLEEDGMGDNIHRMMKYSGGLPQCDILLVVKHEQCSFAACPAIANSNNIGLTCTNANDVRGDMSAGFQCANEYFPIINVKITPVTLENTNFESTTFSRRRNFASPNQCQGMI